MAVTRLYMSVSLDGFVTGPNAGPENGLGDGGFALHSWVFEGEEPTGPPSRPSGIDGQVYDEFMASRAVLVGRGTFEAAGQFGGDHHDGVPIFVLTTRGDEPAYPNVTYGDDLAALMDAAREAAGDGLVMVHGASVLTRLALAAGVLDEVEVHQVPVLLGAGRRLFDGLPGPVPLEVVRVIEGRGVTHLRYRVA